MAGSRVPSPRTLTTEPWHWSQPAASMAGPVRLSARALVRSPTTATASAWTEPCCSSTSTVWQRPQSLGETMVAMTCPSCSMASLSSRAAWWQSMQLTPALAWALSCHCWCSPADDLAWQLAHASPAGCPQLLGSSLTLAARTAVGARTNPATKTQDRDPRQPTRLVSVAHLSPFGWFMRGHRWAPRRPRAPLGARGGGIIPGAPGRRNGARSTRRVSAWSPAGPPPGGSAGTPAAPGQWGWRCPAPGHGPPDPRAPV